MLEIVNNIYNSQDLPGEFFLTPWKNYVDHCMEKIDQNVSFRKLAWVVASVVSAIFAIPTLGGFAFCGMLVKLTGIPFLYRHNERQVALLEAERAGIGASSGDYVSRSISSIARAGYEMSPVDESTYQMRDFDAVRNSIRLQSWRMKKIYLESRIDTLNGRRNITFRLTTLVQVRQLPTNMELL
ncbi:MAG: hypothetical protein ACHQT8_02080 [Chlamydiales bacterium]